MLLTANATVRREYHRSYSFVLFLLFKRVDNVSVYHICRESIYYVLCSKTPGDSVASRAAAIELLSE